MRPDGCARAFDVNVPRFEILREILRVLGYRGGATPPPRTARRIDALWPQAEALLRPRGACRVVDRAAAERAGLPDATETAGLGLVTIGAALEAEARRRQAAGALLDAVVLDAFGSVAVEAAADVLDRALRRTARSLGRHPARRVSPGYAPWSIECQPRLFALLPASDVGVTLTEGLMMSPVKSVSFGVRFAEEAPPEQPSGSAPSGSAPAGGACDDRCSRCEMEDCRMRREDGGTR